MKPLDFPLLADENIHPDVILFLRGNGYEVQSLFDLKLSGVTDLDVLRTAYQSSRVILTHDNDFGRLTIFQGQPFIGIIYLRPGHIRAEFTLETLKAVQTDVPDITPPFIIVAERSGNNVNIRVRQL